MSGQSQISANLDPLLALMFFSQSSILTEFMFVTALHCAGRLRIQVQLGQAAVAGNKQVGVVFRGVGGVSSRAEGVFLNNKEVQGHQEADRKATNSGMGAILGGAALGFTVMEILAPGPQGRPTREKS